MTIQDPRDADAVHDHTVSAPRIVTTIAALRTALREYREQGGSLGLVPTMGALHEGHLSLVRASRQECDRTIVTIFVNPTQFGPREDLAQYPRTFAADVALLAREQVDLVFAPASSEVYPAGFSTYVEPPAVALPLEGQCRPGHFRGVATVVLKLFQLIPADVAYFGQKDYQQYLVIQRMVEDLNVPIAIRRCPIVRESDGLAMSSRNRYLSPAGRLQATALSRALAAGRQRIEQHERRRQVISELMCSQLAAAGISRWDYATAANPDTLAQDELLGDRAVLLVAAYVEQTRLIDNCLIE